MEKENSLGRGLRIGKNESALDRIKGSVPHWIHHTKQDRRFVTGVVYVKECYCSNCGYEAQREMAICPGCRKQMHRL